MVDVDGAALVPDGDRMRHRPTVVLLHRGPGGFDHSCFKPDFARLAEAAQVVYLDLLGHGRSEWGDPTALPAEHARLEVLERAGHFPWKDVPDRYWPLLTEFVGRPSTGSSCASTSKKGGLMSGYAVAHLDEIDEMDDGRCPWRPVRHHFGITAFGVNAWTGRETGDRIINEHDESEEDEELYLVLSGHAVFELDGERRDAPAGTLVFARPGVNRTAFAEEPETTIIALGGTPGRAYEPHGWELWAPLRPLYEAGEYAEVADRGRALVDAHPQYADLFYNVACCESLAGRTTDAINHLRRSIEMSERFRAYAKEDSDFDPIRNEPAFKELIGS